LTLQAVLGLAVVIGFVSTARIFGNFFEYVIRWMWPLAASVAMVSFWCLWRAAADPAAALGARRGVHPSGRWYRRRIWHTISNIWVRSGLRRRGRHCGGIRPAGSSSDRRRRIR